MLVRDKVIFSIVSVQCLAAGGYFLWSKRAKALPPASVTSIKPQQVIDSSAEFRGSSDAPYTLVEFGDYQCPPCAAAHPRVLSLLARKGTKLKFQFRHFPLTKIHPVAQTASEYAETFRQEGKFYKIHDEIYSKKGKINIWEFSRADVGDAAWKSAKKHVSRDVEAANSVGLEGTPTFYLCTPENRVFMLNAPEQADSLIP